MKKTRKQEWAIDLLLIDIKGYVPDFLEVRPSTLPNAGLGVFSRSFIPQNTFLGNYMGRRTAVADDTNPYLFQTVSSRDQTFYIDASDPKNSNFTRYMNCATAPQNENVTSVIHRSKTMYFDSFSIDGYIMFFTKRDIAMDEELLYDYGENSRRAMGIGWLAD